MSNLSAIDWIAEPSPETLRRLDESTKPGRGLSGVVTTQTETPMSNIEVEWLPVETYVVMA